MAKAKKQGPHDPSWQRQKGGSASTTDPSGWAMIKPGGQVVQGTPRELLEHLLPHVPSLVVKSMLE